MKKKQLQIEDLQIKLTADQSPTYLHKELGAHYRSVQGAETESNHVFIQGTRIREQAEWRIIELGFGLATNFQNLLKQAPVGQLIQYISIDHQPAPPEVIEGSGLGARLAASVLTQARETGETAIAQHGNIVLTLIPDDIDQVMLPKQWANACFHDPFGPKVNPEGWTVECFSILYQAMSADGILSTYGAAGHAKRAMVAAGFWIASGEGYGRKREITYAAKNPERLKHGVLNQKKNYQPR